MSIGAKRFLGVVLVAVALAGCSASESNDVAAAEPDSESTVADVTTTTPFPCSGPKGDRSGPGTMAGVNPVSPTDREMVQSALVEAEALELAIEAGGNQPMAVTEWRAQDGITKLGFGAAYQFDRPTDRHSDELRRGGLDRPASGGPGDAS